MRDKRGYTTTLNRLSGINGGDILPYRLQNSGTKVLISPPLVPCISSRKAVRLAAVFLQFHGIACSPRVNVSNSNSFIQAGVLAERAPQCVDGGVTCQNLAKLISCLGLV